MITHIVMWKLKDDIKESDKRHYALEIKRRLENLKVTISEIIDINVGINAVELVGNFDLVLICSFNNLEDMQAYQIHPNHKKVVEYIKPCVTERSCVDYIKA